MTSSRQTHWYMDGVASWFTGVGIQGTLYPWLIAVELGESALRVGAAQTASMLPALLLMLLGGAFADRHDCRRILLQLHWMSSVPPLALALALAAGYRSYTSIVLYAIAMGCLAAFAIPARDSLLSRVAGSNLQRAVTLTITVQTVVQIVGTVIGGAAAALGAPWVLIIQAVANALGAIACWRLLPAPPAPRAPPGHATGRLTEIAAGLRELLETPRLLAVSLLNVWIGLLFLGAFMVAMPLIVRDVYDGSAPEIAAINGSMMLGMVAGAAGLLARGGVRRLGRAVVLSLAVGGAMLIGVSLGPPLAVVYGLIFLFGLGGGVAMPSSQTLVQEAAPASHRARILSVYRLSFMGAAPVGAFAMGALAERLGPLQAIAIPGASMLLVLAFTLFTSDVWRYGTAAPKGG
jgi:MFS family permease